MSKSGVRIQPWKSRNSEVSKKHSTPISQGGRSGTRDFDKPERRPRGSVPQIREGERPRKGRCSSAQRTAVPFSIPLAPGSPGSDVGCRCSVNSLYCIQERRKHKACPTTTLCKTSAPAWRLFMGRSKTQSEEGQAAETSEIVKRSLSGERKTRELAVWSQGAASK